MINSDDPGVFGYDGLSYDFWEAVMAWKLDLRAVKKLIMNSIEYSGMNPEEKRSALEAWRKEWDKFIRSTLDSME